MVLFPSLSEWTNTTSTSSTSTSSGSSVEPITVVQLLETIGLDFWNEQLLLDGKNKLITYHAIQTTVEEKEEVLSTRLPGAKRHTHKNLKHHPTSSTPNVGIWNVPTVQSNILSKTTTIQPKNNNTTFLWTLDLSKPNLLSSNIQSCQTATCHFFNDTTTTTTTFGEAPNATTTVDVPWEKGQIVVIGIVPSMKSTTTFQEKQIHCLIQYHLHKFAATVGATLVFVSTSEEHTQTNNDAINNDASNNPQNESNSNPTTTNNNNNNNNNNSNSGMSIADLISILPTLCCSSSTKNEDEGKPEIPKHIQDFVHTDFDMEVIDSTMLRNASCPGLWDANTQSLTQVFSSLEPTKGPTTTTTTNTTTSATSNNHTNINATNDQKWLQTLADSMSDIYNPSTDDAQSVVSKKSTTSRKSTKSSAKKSSSKASLSSSSAPNDADVGSFFADLLKK